MTEREALEALYVKAVSYIATKSNPYARRCVLHTALEELENAALEVLRTKTPKRGKGTK